MSTKVRTGWAIIFLAFCVQAQGQVSLSEVMYNPVGAEYHDEYVELVNTSQTEAVDLQDWCLGNEEELDLLVDSGTGLILQPGQFAMVLDGSYAGHSATYENLRTEAIRLTIEDRAFGRTGWSNSREEAVILCDAEGDTVEVFRYQPLQRPGFSWEKVDLKAGAVPGNWKPALVEGGTPGRLNSVWEHLQFSGERIELLAAPNPFLHKLVLSYRLPAAPALVNLWVYDVEGRRIRELMSGAPVGPSGEAEWDGQDREGRVVPAGMYIIYMEASAAGTAKKVKKVVVRSTR